MTASFAIRKEDTDKASIHHRPAYCQTTRILERRAVVENPLAQWQEQKGSRSTNHPSTPSSFVEHLLAAERSFRARPALAGTLAVAAFAALAVAKIATHGDLDLALSFSVPVLLCAYGLGVVAGMVMATVASAFWMLDALDLGMDAQNAAYFFALRFLMNGFLVVMGRLAATALRERDRHIAMQREMDTLRHDLVAAFSHDLRTPLTTMVGYAEILHDEVTDPRHRDMLSSILANAWHLDGLVSDILGVERSTSGAALEVTTFDAESLVGDLDREFDLPVASQPISLTWNVEPGTPQLQTDHAKLASVVRNLVGNAIKFTRHGSVTVQFGYDTAAAVHRIEVADTGPGIAPAVLPQIFGRFYRGTASQPGFGFGLFIVKRFVELLGGAVRVESEVGLGTRFALIVPRLGAAAASPSVTAEQGDDGSPDAGPR